VDRRSALAPADVTVRSPLPRKAEPRAHGASGFTAISRQPGRVPVTLTLDVTIRTQDRVPAVPQPAG
jgi:hypothetical protein